MDKEKKCSKTFFTKKPFNNPFLHCFLPRLQPGRLDFVCGQSLFSLVLAIFAHLSPPQIFDWFRKQVFWQFLANFWGENEVNYWPNFWMKGEKILFCKLGMINQVKTFGSKGN